MSLIKEANGTYTVRWRETDPTTGKTRHRAKRGFKLKREAKEYEDRVESLKHFHSFETLSNEYLDNLKGYANSETIEGKRRMYETYCEMFYFSEIWNIYPKTMQKWKDYLLDIPLSVNTKNQIITNVRAVSRFGATNYNYPDFAKTVKRFPIKSSDKREMHIMSVADFNKVMENCENIIYRSFFIFLYHTGCRRGEAMALLKSDIHGNKADLNKSVRRYISSNMKTTQSRRTITLDEDVMKAIEPLMSSAGDYLFYGERPLAPTSIERYWKTAVKKAGVKLVRIHDLRHSFVSNAILNGANIVVVSKYVGHKNVTQTLDTYSHLLKTSEEEMISDLSKIYRVQS